MSGIPAEPVRDTASVPETPVKDAKTETAEQGEPQPADAEAEEAVNPLFQE